MNFYVYIIKCSDNYIYTGITNSIKRRLDEHRNGMCELTKNRMPIRLVYTESFPTRIEAARREKEIKGWRREKKEILLDSLH